MVAQVTEEQLVKTSQELEDTQKKFLEGLNVFMGIVGQKIKARLKTNYNSNEEIKNICNNQLNILKYFKQEIRVFIKDLEEFNRLGLKKDKQLGQLVTATEKAFSLSLQKIEEEEEILNKQLAALSSENCTDLDLAMNKEIDIVKDFFRQFLKINVPKFTEYLQGIGVDFPFFGAKRGLSAVLGAVGRIIATYEDVDSILQHYVERK